MSQEGRVRAERLVRELQDKLGRATAKNATLAEGMVSSAYCFRCSDKIPPSWRGTTLIITHISC
eukprot:COSAG02_NODE_2299_length_9190_cov_122.517655_14_plen_64_part_00